MYLVWKYEKVNFTIGKELAIFEVGFPLKRLTYIEELISCCNNKIQQNLTGSLQIAVTCWVLRIM